MINYYRYYLKANIIGKLNTCYLNKEIKVFYYLIQI
jgi:hypothetical protein